MKTIAKIPVTYEFVYYIPDTEDMVDNKIYISTKFHLAVHKCLCGCGKKTVTPFYHVESNVDHIEETNTENKEDGWCIKIVNNLATFTPSILNDILCPKRAHYVITNGIANILER